MTCSEKLKLLACRLSPDCSDCGCALSRTELAALLDRCGGDVDKASYEACLRLAQCNAVVTPELETESTREYWLSLARLYRPNKTRALCRADERSAADDTL